MLSTSHTAVVGCSEEAGPEGCRAAHSAHHSLDRTHHQPRKHSRAKRTRLLRASQLQRGGCLLRQELSAFASNRSERRLRHTRVASSYKQKQRDEANSMIAQAAATKESNTGLVRLIASCRAAECIQVWGVWLL